jgi:hypothetical protein
MTPVKENLFPMMNQGHKFIKNPTVTVANIHQHPGLLLNFMHFIYGLILRLHGFVASTKRASCSD